MDRQMENVVPVHLYFYINPSTDELLGLVALFKKYLHMANMHVYVNYIHCSTSLHLRHGCLDFIRQFINYAASFS